MDDETNHLAEQAAQGDQRAVAVLLERYLPHLRAFVRARMDAKLRARESGSDLVQSTCREVLEHIERFQFPSEGAFKHWLFTTAQRKIANRFAYLNARKRDPDRERAWPEHDAEHDLELASAYRAFSSPTGRAAREEEIRRVEAALDELTTEQREVVVLAHIVGLSRGEIALELGKSEGAVRATLHRALARVSALLE